MLVAFLRGVNIGSHNKVPQKPLAARLADELAVPVRAHLQSGNLVVGGGKKAGLAALVTRLVREDTGLDVPVVVRTAAELEKLLAANPWPSEDPIRVHLSMWDSDHDAAAAKAMVAADWGGDEIEFSGRNAWLHFRAQSHSSKLGNQAIEQKLKVTATARNARTIQAVAALARELA